MELALETIQVVQVQFVRGELTDLTERSGCWPYAQRFVHSVADDGGMAALLGGLSPYWAERNEPGRGPGREERMSEDVGAGV